MGFFDFLKPVYNFSIVFTKMCKNTLTKIDKNYYLTTLDLTVLIKHINSNSSFYAKNIAAHYEKCLRGIHSEQLEGLTKEELKDYTEYLNTFHEIGLNSFDKQLELSKKLAYIINKKTCFNAKEFVIYAYEESLNDYGIKRSYKQEENDERILNKLFWK